MSDYIPTTEEVRFAMVGLRMSADRFVTRDSFDRWLSAHDAEVRASTWRRFATDDVSESFRMLIASDPTETDVAAWLATHDAKVRAGVVAEEPEWEPVEN